MGGMNRYFRALSARLVGSCRPARGERLALGLVILLSVIAQRVWIARNQAPPELLDDADHLWTSLSLYQTLIHQGFAEFIKHFINTASHYYHPPLIPALTAPFYAVFGPSVAAALWINTLFLVLFYVYLFRLVREWAGDGPALAAVLINALFPMTYGLARLYLLEFGVAALVVVWLYYFYRSQAPANGRYVPALGLLLGAGLLTKATFPIYIVGPIIWELLYQSRTGWHAVWRSSRRILLVSGIGGLLALPWYWHHADWVWKGAHYISGDLHQTSQLKSTLSWVALLTFWRSLLTEGTSVYFFVLGLVLLGLWLVLRRRLPVGPFGFVLAWWLPPFLLCSLMSEKIGRYLFPAFPAVAALLGLLYGSLVAQRHKTPWLAFGRTLAPAVLLLIPLGNFFQLSFFDVWTRPSDRTLHYVPYSVLDVTADHEFTYRPRTERWPLDTILSTLQAHTFAKPPREIRCSIYFMSYALPPANLWFLALARDLPLAIYPLICAPGSLACCLLEEQADREFLLIERPTMYGFELEELLDGGLTPYRELAAIHLPPSRKTQLVIYKRIPDSEATVPLSEE